MKRAVIRAIAPGLLLPWGFVATAQTYTVNGISPITAFGDVAAGEVGDTVFYQNNTTVTVASGAGARIKGTVRRATVTIRCQGSGTPNTCTIAGNRARIRIGSLSSTGRAKAFSEFIAINGTGSLSGTTTGPTLDFTMTGWTGTGTRTFTVDTKLPIAGDNEGGAGGNQTSTYYVYVDKDPNVPTTGSTVAATVTIRRSLRMVKDSDLRFGSVVKQASGSAGQLLINMTTGARTNTGNVNMIPVPGQSVGRAQFTITGEPGTTFNISYLPTGTVTMTSASSTLSLTVTKTASGNQTMPAGGTLVLGIGGSMTILSTTARGAYTGNLAVTVTYN